MPNLGLQASGSNTVQCGDWTGACDNGTLLLPATSRLQQNHCGGCDAGHYLDGRACADCNGFECALLHQQREGSCGGTQTYTCANRCGDFESWLVNPSPGRCSSCENVDCTEGGAALYRYQGPICGHGLDGCVDYAGECENGALVERTARRRTDQCGFCDAGFALTGQTCVSIAGPSASGGDDEEGDDEEGDETGGWVAFVLTVIILSVAGGATIWYYRKKNNDRKEAGGGSKNSNANANAGPSAADKLKAMFASCTAGCRGGDGGSASGATDGQGEEVTIDVEDAMYMNLPNGQQPGSKTKHKKDKKDKQGNNPARYST